MTNEKELFQVWQPVTNLKGKWPFEMVFKEITRHNDYLKIVLEDLHNNQVDIIYDDPDRKCPLEYVVWAFHHGTEIGRNHLYIPEREYSGLKDPNSLYFFKVSHSKLIQSFDGNHIANRQLYPEVEHHLYMTGDEMLDVVSNYEPRFIERKKGD